MEVNTQPEHERLQQFVGEWTYENEMVTPGGETERASGKEVVRAIGKTFIQIEWQEPGEDGEQTSITTIGYDPAKGRFVGNFVSSMGTDMWTYEGSLDENRKVLALDTVGPAMDGQGTAPYQDIYELVDANRHLMRSRAQGSDGQWSEFMRMTVTRTK